MGILWTENNSGKRGFWTMKRVFSELIGPSSPPKIWKLSETPFTVHSEPALAIKSHKSYGNQKFDGVPYLQKLNSGLVLNSVRMFAKFIDTLLPLFLHKLSKNCIWCCRYVFYRLRFMQTDGFGGLKKQTVNWFSETGCSIFRTSWDHCCP